MTKFETQYTLIKTLLNLLLLFLPLLSFAKTIGFQENKGQIINQYQKSNFAITHTLRLENFNVNLTKKGFNYDFYEYNNDKITTHRLEFIFRNHNKDFEVIKSDKIEYYENIISNKGELLISFYQKITYKDFYPNIDLEFYITENPQKPFEYNFILHPGADISSIQFDIKGANKFVKSNEIEFKLRFGTLIETLPKSWIVNPNNN